MAASVPRPAALALLSCCLVFGVLLGLTGVAKDTHTTAPSPAHNANKRARRQGLQGLRSVDGRATRTRSMVEQLSQLEQHRATQRRATLVEERELPDGARIDRQALEYITWRDVPTEGLWGPNDEERDELLINSAEDAANGLTWAKKRDAGGDTEAVFRSHVDKVIGINGKWDRLVVEMDESESFSFSFDL